MIFTFFVVVSSLSSVLICDSSVIDFDTKWNSSNRHCFSADFDFFFLYFLPFEKNGKIKC
jgi:hypothetical protein